MNAIARVNQTNKMPPVAANVAAQQDQQQCLPSMAVNVQIYDGLARIVVSGRFDFQVCRNFRSSYAPLIDNAAIQEIQIEMSKVVYLDSSAMGMLLLLNERAQKANKPVSLITATGFVSQVLEVANFSKIFNIKHIGPGSRDLSGLPPIVINNSPITA